MSEVTVYDSPVFPMEDYLGHKVLRTDEKVECLGIRFFRWRAERFAQQHLPYAPTYHLKVEPAGMGRWVVNAYQNRLEPVEPEIVS